jgi:hypothetical protein
VANGSIITTEELMGQQSPPIPAPAMRGLDLAISHEPNVSLEEDTSGGHAGVPYLSQYLSGKPEPITITVPGIAVSHKPTNIPKALTTEELGFQPPESPFMQFVGGTWGPVEATAKIAEGIIKFIPTGIMEGMLALFPENTEAKDIANQVSDMIKEPMKLITVTPQTETGKKLVGGIEWAFNRFDVWGDIVGDYIRENLQPYVGQEVAVQAATTIGGAIKFLPYSLGLKTVFKGPKPLKIITDSKLFDQLIKPEEGITLPPDIVNAGKEPSLTLDALKANPSLAEYVNKRPTIHSPEVLEAAKKTAEYLELEKKYSDALAKKPIDIEEIKSLRTEMTSKMPEYIKPTEEMFRVSAFKEVSKPQVELSPTAKDQFALPGIKQGLEMKGAKEGVTPTLQSAVIPGLKEFVEQDIIPKTQQLGKGLADTWKAFSNFTIPRRGVSTPILDEIMKKKGEWDKGTTLLEMTQRNVENAMDKWSKPEQITFFDNLKTGKSQIDVPRQQMSDMLRALDDELGLALKEKKPSMPWLEDHFRILYKVIPGATEGGIKGIGIRPLQGTKGFFKQHTLADLSEGIALGGEPLTYNPMRMFRYHYADAMKYITTQNMWDGFGEIGAREFVRFGQKPPEGFARLNDRLAKVYFKVEEGMVNAGEWYVEEGVGRLLNKFLSRDLIREVAAGRGLMWVKNSTTAVELGVNLFHGTFEALEATASTVGHGLRTVWNEGIAKANIDKIIEGSEQILKSPGAAIDASRTGGSFVRYFANKEEFLKTIRGEKFIKRFPDADVLINDLFAAGMKNFGMHEDYRINTIQTLKQNLSSNNYIGVALRSIPALNEVMMKPLFDIFIPRVKVGQWATQFTSELARRQPDILSGKITRGELARDVWDFTENKFGEMNFDNLFWDRTFKTSLQAVIRSVTWKLGNLKLFGKAIIGQAKEFYNAAKERRIPELTQEMGWVLGVATTHAAISTIIQTVFTGHPPSEFKDFFWPKINKDGDRISPATYTRDLFSLIASPINYVKHGMAGYIGRFIEVINNKDFYGVQVHDPEENFIQQRVDDLIHMVPVPFGISTTLRLREKGEPIERAIIGNLGFTAAPFYIEQTKAEQLAGDLMQDHMQIGVKTKAEFEKTKLIKSYAREIQKTMRDDPSKLGGIIKRMAEDVKIGKLIVTDADRISRRLRQPLEGKVNLFRLQEALKVWEVSSPEEKVRLKIIIAGKIGRESDTQELTRLKPLIEQFIRESQGGTK